MKYYKAIKIGDGTRADPFRPNIPNGIPFVWSLNICEVCGTYILASSMEIDELEEIIDLKSACESRDLNINDVLKWWVGGD